MRHSCRRDDVLLQAMMAPPLGKGYHHHAHDNGRSPTFQLPPLAVPFSCTFMFLSAPRTLSNCCLTFFSPRLPSAPAPPLLAQLEEPPDAVVSLAVPKLIVLNW